MDEPGEVSIVGEDMLEKPVLDKFQNGIGREVAMFIDDSLVILDFALESDVLLHLVKNGFAHISTNERDHIINRWFVVGLSNWNLLTVIATFFVFALLLSGAIFYWGSWKLSRKNVDG